jgi:hypothetical protein
MYISIQLEARVDKGASSTFLGIVCAENWQQLFAARLSPLPTDALHRARDRALGGN